MEEKSQKDVPYIVHEGIMARMERCIKRFFITTIILIALLVISNVCWIVYENSFVDEVTVTQHTPDGNNNYVGHDGDITNGEADD